MSVVFLTGSLHCIFATTPNESKLIIFDGCPIFGSIDSDHTHDAPVDFGFEASVIRGNAFWKTVQKADGLRDPSET